MTAGMTADVTHRGPLPQTGTLLRAQIGDTLLIEDESVASTPRIGRILAVSSPPGGPTMIVIEVPCALSSPKISSC